MMLKLQVLTFLRISEVTQAHIEARDVPHKRLQCLATTAMVGAKSRVIPLAISGKR